MKKAVCQVADTGPLESLAVMLESAGYQTYLPGPQLHRKLLGIGCDTVISADHLVQNMGYEQPFRLPRASLRDMETCDLYVDIKAHRNGPLVWRHWPNLRNRTLWYRINGGEPEHVVNNGVDYGDERDPPCPILTPNQWYREQGPWSDRTYVCWPPFCRIGDFDFPRDPQELPIMLIHNPQGWGYRDLLEPLRKIGVRVYGRGAPQGVIRNRRVPAMLSRALCLVHAKSTDAPGYALYEALTAACPIVISRRLVWRSHMQELFEEGVTCLGFDQPTHETLDVEGCTEEVREGLRQLSDPETNRRIGENGYNRIKELMWTDKTGFRKFMEGHYG